MALYLANVLTFKKCSSLNFSAEKVLNATNLTDTLALIQNNTCSSEIESKVEKIFNFLKSVIKLLNFLLLYRVVQVLAENA